MEEKEHVRQLPHEVCQGITQLPVREFVPHRPCDNARPRALRHPRGNQDNRTQHARQRRRFARGRDHQPRRTLHAQFARRHCVVFQQRSRRRGAAPRNSAQPYGVGTLVRGKKQYGPEPHRYREPACVYFVNRSPVRTGPREPAPARRGGRRRRGGKLPRRARDDRARGNRRARARRREVHARITDFRGLQLENGVQRPYRQRRQRLHKHQQPQQRAHPRRPGAE